MRAALAHRDYRYLLAASSVSQTGDWLYNVALLVWVYDATGSAGWVAFVTVARLVPYVVAGPFGGVVADLYDRRRVLIVSDLVRAALMFGFVVVTTADGPVAVAAALALIATAAGTAYRPAVVAMLPDMVGERDLAAANAAERLVENLSVVIGPAIGAGLLIVASPAFSFAVNGATFLVSAALAAAMTIRSRGSGGATGARSHLEHRLLQGFRVLGQSADARVLGGYMLGHAFIYGVQSVLLVLVARDQLGSGAEGVGILYAALGLGGIIGAALVGRLARSARLGAVVYGALFLSCAPMAALAMTSSSVPAFVLVMVSSVAAVVLDVLALTQLQRAVPSDVLGRLWGVLDALVVGAIILGALVVGPVIDRLGDDSAFLLLGLAAPVLGLIGVSGLLRADGSRSSCSNGSGRWSQSSSSCRCSKMPIARSSSSWPKPRPRSRFRSAWMSSCRVSRPTAST